MNHAAQFTRKRSASGHAAWRALLRLSLASGAVAAVASCVALSPRAPSPGPSSQTTQPAATQASATSPAAPEAAATAAIDPAQQLTQQVEQYVSNLPMDDLRARLSHRNESGSRAAEELSDTVVGELAASAGRAHVAEPFTPRPATSAASTDLARDGRPEAQPHAPGPATTHAQAPTLDTVGRQATAQPEIIVPAPAPVEPGPAPAPTHGTPATDQDETRIVDIRISPAVLAANGMKPSEATTPEPSNQPATVKTNAAASAGDVRDLLEQLRKEAAGRPDSVGAALRLRLAEWSLTGQAGPEGEWPLQDTEKRQLAESVWQVLQVVARDEATSPAADSEEFEKALESLGATLGQIRPLRIPSAALCWSVENFGHYEPLPEPWTFPTGQASMVVLYCELEGFRTEASVQKPGWHRALLGERLAILTSDGKEIWSYDEPTIEDLCHRPRRDFFVTKKLRIPGNLPAGSYVLKVTIRDQLANRVAETNVPFQIAAAQ